MVLFKGKKHREMDVIVMDGDKPMQLKGLDCHIVDKTFLTRLGLEFKEKIQCKKFNVKPEK
jgi:hypothetical protein